MLRLRWPLVLGYLAASVGLIYVLVPRMGTEIFPDSNSSVFRIRLRAPSGTRVEETERIVLRALNVIQREAGAGNVEITSDFVGVIPSSYPVDLIHLFTSGPQEAIIQVALKPDAPRGEDLRERLRKSLRDQLPACQFSFEAGDIVGQVMSFGSPTPIEVAVLGSNLQDVYGYAQKVQAQLAPLPFLRDLQFAQEINYPTLDIDINRDRAGQFGLTMADVVRSVVPATSSSRFTQPNYWRDPNSGNAFQIQVELPQHRMQGIDELGDIPVMQNGRSEPRLADIAALKPGTMPGLIERYNGQRVVSLTANVHGITLGEAAPKLNAAVARAGAPPRGVSVTLRGQIPPLEQTISGLTDWIAARDPGDLPAAGRELSVDSIVAGHHADHPRGAVRRPADAPADRNHVEHSVVHGRNHGDRNRGGQLDSAGHVRRALPPRRQAAARSSSGRRQQPSARHSDDGGGDDLRHAADGHRDGRGRGAIRAAGPRGDRRPDRIHVRHAHDSAVDLRDPAAASVHCLRFAQSAGSHEPIL